MRHRRGRSRRLRRSAARRSCGRAAAGRDGAAGLSGGCTSAHLTSPHLTPTSSREIGHLLTSCSTLSLRCFDSPCLDCRRDTMTGMVRPPQPPAASPPSDGTAPHLPSHVKLSASTIAVLQRQLAFCSTQLSAMSSTSLSLSLPQQQRFITNVQPLLANVLTFHTEYDASAGSSPVPFAEVVTRLLPSLHGFLLELPACPLRARLPAPSASGALPQPPPAICQVSAHLPVSRVAGLLPVVAADVLSVSAVHLSHCHSLLAVRAVVLVSAAAGDASGGDHGG